MAGGISRLGAALGSDNRRCRSLRLEQSHSGGARREARGLPFQLVQIPPGLNFSTAARTFQVRGSFNSLGGVQVSPTGRVKGLTSSRTRRVPGPYVIADPKSAPLGPGYR